MKLALAIAIAAFNAVDAEDYNQNNANGNSYAENYNSNGYFDSSGAWVEGQYSQYDQDYNENYEDGYVEDMNEDNGNFQYYDSDGQYDASYAVSGYYDDNGDWVQTDDGQDYTQMDDTVAQAYYEDWQAAGGATGYYDADGNWVGSAYEDVPCQSYSMQNYDAQDYDQDADAENYNAAWSNVNNNANQNVENTDWDEYLDECETSTMIRTNNCGSSVVQVDKVQVLCDSPYRSYFGTSNHMASELCEYGDHATVIVFFELTEDIDWMQNVYMTMGLYAGKQEKELLWAVRSVELCNTFVGHSCETKGTYSFAFDVTFDYGQMSDLSLFVPLIEMGFSTRPDEGYNLGGVNIDCKFNSFYQQYDPWYNGKRAHASQTWGAGGLGALAGRFGILVGVALLGVAFGLYTWSRKKSGIEFQGNADELMDDQSKTEE